MIKIKTAFSLGIVNIWRVFIYRLGIKSGFNPVKKISADISSGDFFKTISTQHIVKLDAHKRWIDQHCYFSWKIKKTTDLPLWHYNPFNEQVVDNNIPWWKIGDFNNSIGDIKTVWEASRFDWVLGFTQQACLGKSESIEQLNIWLNDWAVNNPPYNGMNWKCGQEASIRVMHLAMSSLLLKQTRDMSDPLISLVDAHLKRIAPTINYAIAQDNNHGTSEASALFIGGSWLVMNGYSQGKKWQASGRKWLENRAEKLIENDGSFSQYSINYHRVMLDTYCMVEVWRINHQLPPFSESLYYRLKNATLWLYYFVQKENGNAPNLGANDGAKLLPLSNTSYSDYRPTVQLASALFINKCAYSGKGKWNENLNWLNIKLPNKTLESTRTKHFKNGGYSLLMKGSSFALLNYPCFKFRPSQADAMHVDFWHDGINLLKDAGTYSYNTDEKTLDYFNGTQGHNTIQFDDKNQMPRLSRFLFGGWLKVNNLTGAKSDKNVEYCSASYKNGEGVIHQRSVILKDNLLKVTDRISGFKHKATLRWRLHNDNWSLNGNTLSNGRHQLLINSDMPIISIKLIKGLESLLYLKKSSVPVLEVEFNQAGCIQSEYQF